MSFDLILTTAYLICGALLLFLGVVVLRENPRGRVNRAVAGMLVFGGLGPILGAYSHLAARGEAPAGGVAPDVFAQFGFLWEFYFPSVLLFALVFPTLHPLFRRWPRRLTLALFVPHAFHVVLVLLGSDSTNLIERIDPSFLPVGETVLTQAKQLVQVGLELLLRVHVRFFSFINLAMAATSWVLLMRSSRKTRNPKLRSQVRTIRLGIGISLALYSGGHLVPTVFGLVIDRAVVLPLIAISLLTGAVSILIAIVRLQFLDVRFIVRRGLVYGLASGGIVALYLFVGKQFDRLSAQFVGAYVPVFETTFLVLSLFLLQPVLSGIERMVDRGYSRDRSDLRNALTRLAERVSLLLDPQEVCRSVVETLRREMMLTTAAIVTRDRATGAFQLTIARETVSVQPHWGPGAILFDVLAGRREAVGVRELVEWPEEATEREALHAELGRLTVAYAIPLHAASSEEGGELVGVAMLGEKVTETRITFEETALLSLTAHQVAISLMNAALHKEQMAARLLEEEVATARRIQRNLLPQEPPGLSGWQICASNSPSRDVGGDYHDFLPLPEDHVGVAIGDVSGKGIPAALLMSNLQAALRIQALAALPSDRVVAEVNRHIYRTTGSESFISFFLGQLEPTSGAFTFTNAGHNAPLLVRRDGSLETLDAGGLLLGVFPEATYETGRVALQEGDLLALYTDGVTEASNASGDLYSEERLVETLRAIRGGTAAEVHDGILRDVQVFQDGRPPDDDLTLILLKRTGNGADGAAGAP